MNPRRRTLRDPIDGATYDAWRTREPDDSDVPQHGSRCRCEGCQDRRGEDAADPIDYDDAWRW